MKTNMQNIDQSMGFYGGSIVTFIYSLGSFLMIPTPFLIDLIKTIILAVVGVFVSGLATYLFKKWIPKIFKK